MTKAFLLGFIAGASRTRHMTNNPFSCTSNAFSEWNKGFFWGCDDDASMQNILKLGE